MKKLLCTAIAITAFSFISYSQDCGLYNFNLGQKFTYESKVYPLTFESDPSMLTGDTRYKVKNSVAFNEKILSGKIQPKKISRMVIEIKDKKNEGTNTVYTADIDNGGAKLTAKYYAGKDSLALVLYNGRTAYVPSPGDTSGVILYGAYWYGCSPKVGDRFRGSSNLTVMAPKTQAVPLRKALNMYFNPVSLTSCSFYEEASNLSPLEGNMYSISLLQPARVIREEKITIMGKEYSAMLSGTETWIKMMQKREMNLREFEQKYLQSMEANSGEPSFEPGGKRLWKKKSGESMDVNEQGFMVTYKEEWLVPGVGIVKTVQYDGNGAIIAVYELKQIE